MCVCVYVYVGRRTNRHDYSKLGFLLLFPRRSKYKEINTRKPTRTEETDAN